MQEKSYHFDAFISYRHNERDKKIVDTIQKLTENYRSPCDGEHILKGERIRRLFTDRSELPMSADLGASITRALAQSRFLLVIASPEYTQSRWCMEELRTFLRYHQNSTDRILFVQVDGPPSCITDILSAAGVCVEAETFHEPLYISACARGVKDSIRIIKKEHLRLAAVLIGCGYDSLYQRHKRAQKRKILATAVVALLVGAIVGTVFAIQARQRKQEADYRDMDGSIARIHEGIRSEDRIDALKAMQALYSQYGQDQTYGDYLARQLESAAVKAGYVPAFSAFAVEPLPFEITGISVSDDGKYVLAYDIASLRDQGILQLCLFDAYLNQYAEYRLPVGEWKEELAWACVGGNSLQIDYREEENTFVIRHLLDGTKCSEELLGRELAFSAEGRLLSNRELTADEAGRTSLELRKIYQEFIALSDRPVCMSGDRLYTVSTRGETGYEVFGPKDEEYMVVAAPVSGDLQVIATPERTSEVHALEDISITPDDRFVLVKETRGVYNDVLTVCDAEGRWEGVRIDLGNHTVRNIQYHFDDKKQEGCFLFNLRVAGEDDKSLIAQCRVASGQLLGSQMYQSEYALDCLLSTQGYVYVVEDTQIKAITTRNLCLSEAITGNHEAVPIRTDTAENDLIENADTFSSISTGGMKSVSVGNLTITPDVARLHHDTPTSYTGNDIGVGIDNETGEEVVRFYADGFAHAYFNQDDGVFGLIDYADPENSEVFRLYDFYSLMELLG